MSAPTVFYSSSDVFFSAAQLVAPDNLESKFRALEGSDVDDELRWANLSVSVYFC